MTIWHGMIKLVEVKKFNKDMAVADKDNRDNSTQDNSIQDNNKTATTSSELQQHPGQQQNSNNQF